MNKEYSELIRGYWAMNEDQKHDEIIAFFSDPEIKESIPNPPDVNLVFSHANIMWPDMTVAELARIMNRLMDENEMADQGRFYTPEYVKAVIDNGEVE